MGLDSSPLDTPLLHISSVQVLQEALVDPTV